MMKTPFILFSAACLTLSAGSVSAVDEAAALALIKASKCSTCHSVDKEKDGPSFKSVAADYRDDPEAEAKLIKLITEPHMIEIDGEEEEHGVVKSRDEANILNLAQWILSR